MVDNIWEEPIEGVMKELPPETQQDIYYRATKKLFEDKLTGDRLQEALNYLDQPDNDPWGVFNLIHNTFDTSFGDDTLIYPYIKAIIKDEYLKDVYGDLTDIVDI